MQISIEKYTERKDFIGKEEKIDTSIEKPKKASFLSRCFPHRGRSRKALGSKTRVQGSKKKVRGFKKRVGKKKEGSKKKRGGSKKKVSGSKKKCKGPGKKRDLNSCFFGP